MAEERIDVLDESGRKTGATKTKKEAHKRGLWHGASHIWIYNTKGKILLQKRSMEKDSWPGKWDVSAAGHISAGETPKKAALRELKEEVGISAKPTDLKRIIVSKDCVKLRDNYDNKEFQSVYLYKLSKIPKELQKEEVEAVKFVPLSELERELKDPRKSDKYVPHGYYPDLVKILKKFIG
ncbi:MAG: NUDIX domain-containing protein [Candidatus Micrarchaeota archaeon]|nr:NUDIX domain-containing protein [Candidatus Micrarchaeota archaeon]